MKSFSILKVGQHFDSQGKSFEENASLFGPDLAARLIKATKALSEIGAAEGAEYFVLDSDLILKTVTIGQEVNKKEMLSALQKGIDFAVENYSRKIAHISPLVKRSMLQAYREGFQEGLDGGLNLSRKQEEVIEEASAKPE